MKMMSSLQARLAVAVGVSVTILWLAAAIATAHRLGQDMEEVYNDGLKATAERILPIAQHDLREGHQRRESVDDEEDDDVGRDPRQERKARYGEDVTFILRDRQGRVLLGSAGADASIFPPFERQGFSRTRTHQLYYAASANGNLVIAVAEPLDRRRELSQSMLLGLLLPLLVVIPLSLVVILFAVRYSLRPVRALRQGLSRRGAQDLSPLPDSGLPSELRPISAGINQLLDRLRAAFEAERAFAANAAHELRTPVAGAIAQAQRIRSETKERLTAQRTNEIEATLKRLMRMSEKLMQLARAEGGRLRADEPSDLRTVIRMIVEDFERAGERQIELTMPEGPVLSPLDPDAVGILSRNLIENALKHGARGSPVEVVLEPEGVLCVANDGATLPTEAMDRLMRQFERGNVKIDGSGLGLAIVKAIADRVEAAVDVVSPRSGKSEGVEVRVRLPIT
ncbi:ATP-binding protein [Rhizobium sp. NLR16a]|uniref:ATP-binding protein n=3 Tax=Rhizobium/Agrobacterium group TaxID=227290 RepID=UPI001B328C27|nr:ATP-binding protein [Rhizobium sp. NLR16a]MBX4908832.1 HAMP domain-containing protein [Rhizobium bangladeshense]MBX5215967.1 HAMP domain-containing protein [Rhizobium sp. NLR9a]MBX5222877.1 HAMP domain-containing protein [Rhizobium sp. NLR8a]MBX5227347.1 HAMP domain-containing protein [Rhizobium sp. NLR9b]MBX5234344.1 HAMP domain-containing protein [Rhizobium sp. NLR4a]MBX5246665.1 HAMP domain-containing protein [Rhizobium sp. NLR3b]MBX5251346.1 HAMP domain-containing protein [Rhizobium s